MEKKRLAVLMPVYNDSRGLAKTLKSLSNVKTKFDLFIVDDGSKPPLVVENKLENVSIYLLKLETNKGIEEALNYGINTILAKDYEYIARIDAGDEYVAGRFPKQMQLLKEKDRVGLVGGFVEVVNDKGELLYIDKPPVDSKALKKAFFYNNYIYHPAVMFKVNVFRTVGLYSKNYPAAEDYDFFRRCLKVFDAENIPAIVLKYVVSSGQISGKKRRIQTISRLRIQVFYFEWTQLDAYLGVIKSIIALCLPRKSILWGKSVIYGKRKNKPEQNI